jgi:CelD/BcsL family acetyltransferase involved in cellulose biosynthesis
MTSDRPARQLERRAGTSRPAAAVAQTERNLDLEVVTTDDGLLALRADWDGLHEAMGSADGPRMNPFTSWTFVWEWWQAHARTKRFAQPRVRLHIVVVRDIRQQVRAILPFVQARWGVGSFVFRALRFYGFGPNLAELRGPLVWPGWETDVAYRLAQAWRGSENDVDMVVLEGLVVESPFTQRLQALAHTEGWRWAPDVPNYVLELPESWQAFRSAVRRNLRENIRHGYNSLKRDGHAWSFEVIEDPHRMGEAVKDVFRLHAARAAPDSKPRHRDYYTKRANRDALKAIAASMSREGRFGVARMCIGGQSVAARFVFIGSDALYLHDAGADPAWSYYAIATTLTSECLRWGMERGARRAYLATGVDPSKARWGGQQQMLRRLLVPGPTARGRIAPTILNVCMMVRRLLLVSQLLVWKVELLGCTFQASSISFLVELKAFAGRGACSSRVDPFEGIGHQATRELKFPQRLHRLRTSNPFSRICPMRAGKPQSTLTTRLRSNPACAESAVGSRHINTLGEKSSLHLG